MWWRARTGDADLNRAAMYEVVASGRVVGLLAYRDERPVGWLSVGRRADFPLLSASRRYGGGQDAPGTWAITCFSVPSRERGTGVGSALLDSAIRWARDAGASWLEAYPNRKPDYMGKLESYLARGFEIVREAPPRTVVRLAFHAGDSKALTG